MQPNRHTVRSCDKCLVCGRDLPNWVPGSIELLCDSPTCQATAGLPVAEIENEDQSLDIIFPMNGTDLAREGHDRPTELEQADSLITSPLLLPVDTQPSHGLPVPWAWQLDELWNGPGGCSSVKQACSSNNLLEQIAADNYKIWLSNI